MGYVAAVLDFRKALSWIFDKLFGERKDLISYCSAVGEKFLN